MKITIITLFPQVFEKLLDSSILKRAQNKGKVEFEVIDLRGFGIGRHKTVDDKPYGGGVGMVLRADVLAEAVKRVKGQGRGAKARVILTSASGKTFTQSKAKELCKLGQIIIVCGHYEGVDERFVQKYADDEISIGDYVLTGGEIPAMAIADAVVRLIPGVLEKEEATQKESFENNMLEHPQYTRPEIFEGIRVPGTLLSGNHKMVDEYRNKESNLKTKRMRPDLIKKIN